MVFETEFNMTTASVLVTVTTSWNVSGEKIEKEGCLTKNIKNYVSESALEIRETPVIREQGLRIMREWIQQNNDIKNVRLGMSSSLFYCCKLPAGS